MRVLIAGDFCEKLRVADAICNKDYKSIWGNIEHVVMSHEYSIVNFEFPIADKNAVPIKKYGPNLKGTLGSIEAIKNSGFSCVTLANNHILDQGDQCCLMTKKLLENNNIDTVGVGSNMIDASRILYKNIGNETVAIINCCEHEFSVASDNHPGACPLNAVRQYYSIIEAKKRANYTIVIVHGGHEHFQLPSLRMKELYHFFIDLGADAVINHHQHCYSGYEYYNQKPIFYGLGNLLFDHEKLRFCPWNEGYMVSIEFNPNKVLFELHPYKQCNEKPQVILLSDEDKKIFNEHIKRLNDIIADDERLSKEIDNYYHRCSKGELRGLEFFKSRFTNKLRALGILPSIFDFGYTSRILNHVECESHRDKLLYALKNKLYD